MRVKSLLIAGLAVAAACTNGRQHTTGDPGAGTITIDPTAVTLDLMNGGPAQTASFKVTFHGKQSTKDVTAAVVFALNDPTLGTMSGNIFTSGTAHGGSSTLSAIYDAGTGGQLTTTASIHVRVHGSFTDPSCSGCAPFPPSGAPSCAAGAAPTIVYPPDNVLLPPNLGQVDVHFNQGTGASTFELDFSNPATDVKVLTKCTPLSDTRGTPVAGGCAFQLSAATWDFIAQSNKGGDPIQITIRATTDGSCASASTNTTRMMVAEEDIAGGIYYWKSTVTAAGTGGEIWRKSFGDAKPEERISPASTGGFSATCYGCHFLSRDGLRMTISADDSDSDDEYSDVSMGLVDVAAKTFITTIGYAMGQAAGFQTFSNDHSLYIGSNGAGDGSRTAGGGGIGATNVFFIWNGAMGTDATPASVTVGPTGARPTQPDWSVDNKQIVFVLPTLTGWCAFPFPGVPCSRTNDDTHVYGGSLWSLPYMGSGMFGTPIELVHSTGDNNYYPTISPDGSFIAYDHVAHQTTSDGVLDTCTLGSCPNDSFSNPKARVWMIPASKTVATPPIDLEAANGSPASGPVDVSNSWPRWSPFLQKYKGQKLLWLTFSSTRDYGLRVRNHVTVGGQAQVQCYPPDSAEDPNGSHGQQFPSNCQQPQIWMAAVNLSGSETGSTADPSFPAFWLPFQDIQTHNHSAQWTSAIVTMPPTTCAAAGQSCLNTPCCATAGICLATGTCGVP